MNEPKVIRIDLISCPACETIQKAEVTQHVGDLWPSFTHRCIKCNYIVMESEWNEVMTETVSA